MKNLGSVIARIGSKRLPFKNLLPYRGVPLVLHAVRRLIGCGHFDEVVLSTDSELIARTCLGEKVKILKRPSELATDEVASIPVFQHIVEHFPCDIHVNYNCNFPECPDEVFLEAIRRCSDQGESLSDPFAVWAQSKKCLENYGNPFEITAPVFKAKNIYPLDIHTMEDLLETHKYHQGNYSWK